MQLFAGDYSKRFGGFWKLKKQLTFSKFQLAPCYTAVPALRIGVKWITGSLVVVSHPASIPDPARSTSHRSNSHPRH